MYLFGNFAMPPNAVLRDVGSEVRALSDVVRAEASGLRHRQERAGLRVREGEGEEVEGVLLRQRDEVRLHEARRRAAGLPAVVPRAHRGAELARGPAVQRSVEGVGRAVGRAELAAAA